MSSSIRDALRLSGALDQFKPVPPVESTTGRSDGRGKRGERAVRAERGGERGERSARPGNGARGAGRTGAGKPGPRRPQSAPAQANPGTSAEIDLAKAYALRARSEQREREQKLAAEREVAERRRQQRQNVLDLIDGRTLNRDDAETVRNFEYGGKIRRVYVTDEQLEQVNDGRLGVIQMRGRYLLVERELAQRVHAVDGNAVALLVDPQDAVIDGDAPAP